MNNYLLFSSGQQCLKMTSYGTRLPHTVLLWRSYERNEMCCIRLQKLLADAIIFPHNSFTLVTGSLPCGERRYFWQTTYAIFLQPLCCLLSTPLSWFRLWLSSKHSSCESSQIGPAGLISVARLSDYDIKPLLLFYLLGPQVNLFLWWNNDNLSEWSMLVRCGVGGSTA